MTTKNLRALLSMTRTVWLRGNQSETSERARVMRIRAPLALVSALLVAAPNVARGIDAAAAGDIFDQFFRFPENSSKPAFSGLPGETVDPFTGTLSIVQEDILLPGKAGLDLRVQHFYNSRIWARTDLLDTAPLLAEQSRSVLGYGWDIHMGVLDNPYASGSSGICGGQFPIFKGPDGSYRSFYPAADSSNTWLSRDYWRLQVPCDTAHIAGDACMWSDRGIRYEFSAADAYWTGGTTPSWPVKTISDTFGNTISVSYVAQSSQAGPLVGMQLLIDTITDTYGRTIQFSYTVGLDGYRLDKLIANSSVYQFTYTPYDSGQTSLGVGYLPLPGVRRFLTGVTPPAGPSYSYTYGWNSPVAQNQYALASITYPSGGTTAYTYGTVNVFAGRDLTPVPMPAVSTRTVAGPTLEPGTWRYSYSSPAYGTYSSTDPATGSPSDMHVTTIVRPDGKKDTYTIYGFGAIADLNRVGFTWAVGQTREIARADRAEVETFSWDPRLGNLISNSYYNAPTYSSVCGPYYTWDQGVASPVLKKRYLQRDGAMYVTEYSNFDAYGQAQTVTETGYQGAYLATPAPAVRTTTSTYFYVPLDGNGAHVNIVRGRPLTEHVCVGNECFDSGWTYNGPGYARDSQTLSGITTTFGYYNSGALDGGGSLKTITNARNETVTLSGYLDGHGTPTTIDMNGAFSIHRTATWDGWLVSQTDGNGHTTSYTYDAIGRPLTVTPPGNNEPTTYTYAPDDSSVTVTRGKYSLVTLFDGLGRTASTSDSEGTLTSTRYDSMGRAWFKSYPYTTIVSTTNTSPIGEVGERLDFDGLGRVVTLTKAYRPATNSCDVPGACTLAYEFTANCTKTTVQRGTNDSTVTGQCSTSFGNADEAWLTQIYDGMGNLWQYVRSVTGALEAVDAPLAEGNRSYVFDPVTHLLSSETSGDTGTTSFGRNEIGQIKTRTDARKIITTYGYDDRLSRLRTIIYGSGSPDDVTQSFDNANNLKHVESSNGGAHDVSYDEVNRVSSQVWTYGGKQYTTTYGYDRAGCLTSMTYPSGLTLAFTCDTANRVTSVSVGSDVIASGIVYHPSGQPQVANYGNGTSLSVTYDDRTRAKAVTLLGPTALLSPTLSDLSYGFDGASNVISFVNKATSYWGNTARTMTYDEADRLETSVAQYQWGSAIYQYDALGNRNFKSVGSYTTNYVVDDQNRLASATGPESYAPLTLTWSLAGHLESSSDGATYAYNGRGQRIQKADPNQTTLYHYDASGRLIEETLPDGTKLRDYIYLGNKLLAVDECAANGARPCTTTRQWYHTDVLGSVIARTDSAGAIVAQLDYEPWGEQWAVAGSSTSNVGNRQYNGRVYDQGTGFHDYGARMYWPQIGRFVSADPAPGSVENPQSLNRYSYVLNNPYKYVDPTGQDAVHAMAWAVWQVGSTAWSKFATHPLAQQKHLPFLKGIWADKCNLFVYDALQAGGDAPGLINGRPPVASEWADPNVVIDGYVMVDPGDALQEGDIISDGHHVGLYLEKDGKPAVESASTLDNEVVHNYWGFRKDSNPIRARRFKGDFKSEEKASRQPPPPPPERNSSSADGG